MRTVTEWVCAFSILGERGREGEGSREEGEGKERESRREGSGGEGEKSSQFTNQYIQLI